MYCLVVSENIPKCQAKSVVWRMSIVWTLMWWRKKYILLDSMENLVSGWGFLHMFQRIVVGPRCPPGTPVFKVGSDIWWQEQNSSKWTTNGQKLNMKYLPHCQASVRSCILKTQAAVSIHLNFTYVFSCDNIVKIPVSTSCFSNEKRQRLTSVNSLKMEMNHAVVYMYWMS